MLDIVFKVMDVIGDGDITVMKFSHSHLEHKYIMKQIKMRTKNIEIEFQKTNKSNIVISVHSNNLIMKFTIT